MPSDLSKGNKYCSLTMTVGELISELMKHPQELPVIVTWEGQITELSTKRIYAEPWGEQQQTILVIDADDFPK